MPFRSLFPQSCESSVIKSHWPSKSNSLGGSQSLCQIPRLGNLLWALELLQQCEHFFGIIVLQFVGCLLCSFMVGLKSCASQVCCSQSPCPRGRPLLTLAATRDTHTLKDRSGSVTGVHKVVFESSEHLSYFSCGSQGKNTEVVCHSLLQWTTFCQNSPP